MTWKKTELSKEEYATIENMLFTMAQFIHKEEPRFDPYSLMLGKGGNAIFYAYMYKAFKEPQFKKIAYDLIEEIIKNAAPHLGKTFVDGYPGTTWLIAHLNRENIIDIDIKEIIDDEIEKYMKICSTVYLFDGNYDLFYGGLGACFYFFETKKIEIIKSYVHMVNRLAVRNGDEITWYESPVMAVSEGKLPAARFNFSYSHGVPSIIYFLSLSYYHRIEKELCYQLIDGAIKWLAKYEMKDSNHFLPKRQVRVRELENLENIAEHIPLGWRDGDLGVAIGLFLAGYNCKNQGWQDLGIKISKKCLKRNEEGLTDSNLCQGTSGAGHIYNRLYNYTGDKEFQHASLLFQRATISRAKFEHGKIKYSHFLGNYGRIESSGLLYGEAGIGLSLLSLITDIEPKWDRCLLLS